MQSLTRAIVTASLGVAAVAAAAPAVAQERFNVGGSDVAIFNLAGEVQVGPTRGGEVTVEVRRGGRDAQQLDIRVGDTGGRQTLRVIYPSHAVVYPGAGRGYNANIRVREDGTWGRDRDGWRDRGHRVEVSGRGSGLEAWADLSIGVPRGQRIDIYLAVGKITATNVDGTVRLDTHVGTVEATRMSGHLTVDTGSGSVLVRGMQGDLDVDTGSGTVRVSDIAGQDVGIDTGSGTVEARGVTARRIEIDTGSGGIQLLASSAADVRLDTGSGSVAAELANDIERLVVDTGSGSVTLRLPESLGASIDIETGSGGIEVDFPVMITRRARDELRGTIGDGRGSIKIDTGSGSVRIRRM